MNGDAEIKIEGIQKDKIRKELLIIIGQIIK